MLKAKKSRFFEKIFAIYNKDLLNRRFNSFNVLGLEHLANSQYLQPLIIYANHSSWWDGLIIFQVLQNFNYEVFALMEEKHLINYPLFQRLGAFSVNRENPREALVSLNYAAQILKEKPQRILVIFPQGKLIHNDTRPIYFYNGISRIVEKVENCLLVSLSIRLELLDKFKPEIFVKINKPIEIKVNTEFSSKKLTRELADEMTFCLDGIKNDIVNKNLQNYRNILK